MAGRTSPIWQGGNSVYGVFLRSSQTDLFWSVWGGSDKEDAGRGRKVVCTDGFKQVAPCTVSPRKAGERPERRSSAAPSLKHTARHVTLIDKSS